MKNVRLHTAQHTDGPGGALISYLWMWGVISDWCYKTMMTHRPFNHYTPPSREERGLNSFPTLAIPWVFYLPCETTNLSNSGLPPILLPRTNGEERGSHSRGAFPQSCHTSHKNPKGRGVKRSNHCPLSTAPPFNPLWTQTLVWLLNTFEAKVKLSRAGPLSRQGYN